MDSSIQSRPFLTLVVRSLTSSILVNLQNVAQCRLSRICRSRIELIIRTAEIGWLICMGWPGSNAVNAGLCGAGDGGDRLPVQPLRCAHAHDRGHDFRLCTRFKTKPVRVTRLPAKRQRRPFEHHQRSIVPWLFPVTRRPRR